MQTYGAPTCAAHSSSHLQPHVAFLCGLALIRPSRHRTQRRPKPQHPQQVPPLKANQNSCLPTIASGCQVVEGDASMRKTVFPRWSQAIANNADPLRTRCLKMLLKFGIFRAAFSSPVLRSKWALAAVMSAGLVVCWVAPLAQIVFLGSCLGTLHLLSHARFFPRVFLRDAVSQTPHPLAKHYGPLFLSLSGALAGIAFVSPNGLSSFLSLPKGILIAPGLLAIGHNFIAFYLWAKISRTPEMQDLCLRFFALFFAICVFVGVLEFHQTARFLARELPVVSSLLRTWGSADLFFFSEASHSTLQSFFGDSFPHKPLLSALAFGQSVHYVIWLKILPDCFSPQPSPRTFAKSLRETTKVSTSPLLLVFLILAFSLPLLAILDPLRVFLFYSALAFLHGFAELPAAFHLARTR